jgi:hypothetical protein
MIFFFNVTPFEHFSHSQLLFSDSAASLGARDCAERAFLTARLVLGFLTIASTCGIRRSKAQFHSRGSIVSFGHFYFWTKPKKVTRTRDSETKINGRPKSQAESSRRGKIEKCLNNVEKAKKNGLAFALLWVAQK